MGLVLPDDHPARAVLSERGVACLGSAEHAAHRARYYRSFAEAGPLHGLILT